MKSSIKTFEIPGCLHVWAIILETASLISISSTLPSPAISAAAKFSALLKVATMWGFELVFTASFKKLLMARIDFVTIKSFCSLTIIERAFEAEHCLSIKLSVMLPVLAITRVVLRSPTCSAIASSTVSLSCSERTTIQEFFLFSFAITSSEIIV